MVQERRITPTPCSRNKERRAESDHLLRQSACKKKKVPTFEHCGSDDGSWEGPSTAKELEEEVTLSPCMRKVFTRLQGRRLMTSGGGASAISKPASQSKAAKKTPNHLVRRRLERVGKVELGKLCVCVIVGYEIQIHPTQIFMHCCHIWLKNTQ